MKYLIEITPPIEFANAVDDSGGPGAVLEKIGSRFKPEAIYGSAAERSIILIVDLPSAADLAELTFVIGHTANAAPRLVPLIDPPTMMKAMQSAGQIAA